MQPEHSVRSNDDVLFAWREGLAEAAPSQDLKQQLLQREGELLPRFAAHYEDLTHLPRSMRRRLQRHWKRSLAGVALLLVLGQTPAIAATINVGGACTLIRAIVAANNDTTDTGHCKKGSGADTIVLPAKSTQTLTAVNNNDPKYGASGLPVIRSTVTIDGNGGTVRRASNAPKFRIFAVGASGDLRLQETTVSGAVTVSIPGVLFSGEGGGLFNYGTLTLANSTVSGNKADTGGGVSNSSNTGPLTVTNSTITSNTVSGINGGGVNNNGVLRVNNSTISGNSVSGFDGGGVNNTFSAYAGITNSTISGNSATRSGGGISNQQGYITVIHALISGNTAASGSEVSNGSNSIVTAANLNLFGHKGLTNAQAFRNFTPSGSGITATSNGNRPTALNRILNTTLANNGGPTKTHALVVGSPAVDAVNDGTCPPPAKDQRGVRRPRDGNGDGGAACDVGSFER